MHNSGVGCGDEEFAALTKGGVMRVLLVEDDRMIGAAVVQALKDAAYAVDWVMDGESALHAAKMEEYQLVLLDLGLPKPDGLDVLKRIRETLPPVPVII